MVEHEGEDGQADDLAALHQLAACSGGPFDQQLSRWLDAGRRILQADTALLAMGSGFACTVAAVSGRPVDVATVGAEIMDGRVHRAISQGVTMAVLTGVGAARSFEAAGLGGGPLVVSPVWTGGEVAGALVLMTPPAQAVHSVWKLALVDVVADGIARVIENEHLGARGLIEGRAAVLELIARDEPVAVALRGACELLAVTQGVRVVILRVVGGHLGLASEEADGEWGSWFAGQTLGFDTPYGQAIATGQPVVVADTARDDRFLPGMVPDLSYRAMIIDPVRSTQRGHTLGLVVSFGRDVADLGAPEDIRGEVRSLVAMALEREAAAQRLAHLVTHDPLTGAGNRAALLDRLDVVLARARRTKRPVAVIYGDLDRFKQINDEYGHLAGDAVLKEVADRLRAAVRPSDTVSRTGGDEFVVVCEDLTDDQQATEIASRITEAVRATPISIGELVVRTSISVGVALADPVLDDPKRLLNQADLAMYDSKHHHYRTLEEEPPPEDR